MQVLIAILARTFLHIIYEFSSYLTMFSTQALNMSGGMGAQVTTAWEQSNSGRRGAAPRPSLPLSADAPLPGAGGAWQALCGLARPSLLLAREPHAAWQGASAQHGAAGRTVHLLPWSPGPPLPGQPCIP